MKPSIFLLTVALATFGVEAAPSAGCGKAPSKIKNGVNTVNVGGINREFIVRLPSNYDNKKPYRVIFAFHATGGTANATARSYYGQLSRAGPTSILVSPQGQGPTAAGGKSSGLIGSIAKGMTGWWWTGGKYGERDIDFVDKIVDTLDADLCVDTNLRFSTGFSFGGVMSYSLACLRPDKFRATHTQSGCGFDDVIGGMSKKNAGKGSTPGKGAASAGGCKSMDSFSSSFAGIDPSTFLDGMLLAPGQKAGAKLECGSKPVAWMGTMGICDGWIQYGREARDQFLKKNGCQPKQAGSPKEGSKGRVMTTYDCSPGAPVIWTEFDGPHTTIPQSEEETWKFFSQFT